MGVLVPNSFSSGTSCRQATDHVATTGTKRAQPGKERLVTFSYIIRGLPLNLDIGRSFIQQKAINEVTTTCVRLAQRTNEIFSTLFGISHGLKRNSNRWSRGDDGVQVYNTVGEVREDQGVNRVDAQIRSLNTNGYPGENKLFVFGFGYTSCALGSYLKEKNWKISGTYRTSEKKAALQQQGFASYFFNSDNDGEGLTDDGLGKLQQANNWLISIPPVADFDGDPVLTTHVHDLSAAVEKGNVRWIGYLSSTGVYGDWQGDLVDEESDPRPVKQSAVARLAAEKAWLSFGFEHGIPVHVFRLGGIYGPGRSAVDTILRNGALSENQQFRQYRRYTSRIHVADICQTVLASMQYPAGLRTYNVVDDDPAPRDEVFTYARDLLRKTNVMYSLHQHKVDVTSKDSERTNLAVRIDEKRVSNKRIKEELGVQLLYPNYRYGLQAILKAVKMTETS